MPGSVWEDRESKLDFLRDRRDDILKYFVKLGKSYYRSPEHEREVDFLREKGLAPSSISQFGIGFLSCFMLADRIRVATNPGEGNGEGSVFEVSGPCSLFFFRKGEDIVSPKHQGTVVTLYLKQEIELVEMSRDELVKTFGDIWENYPSDDYLGPGPEDVMEEVAFMLAPGLVATKWIGWPPTVEYEGQGYPVDVIIKLSEIEDYVIGQESYLNDLRVIETEKLRESAASWQFEAKRLLPNPGWAVNDWTDKDTGSRIRMAWPVLDKGKYLNKQAILQDEPRLLEMALWNEAHQHHLPELRYFISGMKVDDKKLREIFHIERPRSGVLIWMDCRGGIAPLLTADRKSIVKQMDKKRGDTLEDGFRRLLERWRSHLMESGHDPLVTGFWFNIVPNNVPEQRSYSWCGLKRSDKIIRDIILRKTIYLSHMLDYSRTRASDLTGDIDCVHDRVLASNLAIELTSALALDFGLNRYSGRDVGRVGGRDGGRDSIFALDFDFYRDRILTRVIARALRQEQANNRLLNGLIITAWSGLLCEGYAPGRQQYWPGFEWRSRDEERQEWWQYSPAEIKRSGKPAEFLEGYDIISPFVCKLNREGEDEWCGNWNMKRLFNIAQAVFLFSIKEYDYAEEVKQIYQKTLGEAGCITILIPAIETWFTPWEQWGDAERSRAICGCWEVETGKVRYLEGMPEGVSGYEAVGKHILKNGMEFREFYGVKEESGS